jgi:hypothetical protein
MAAPSTVKIRCYHVGFGDCFLVSFFYATASARPRHILIDFGTTAMPRRRPKRTHLQVAQQIAADSGGKLNGVVATHRHADHISGFAGSSGEVIASLQPSVVLQPWTEDPDLEPDARAPRTSLTGPPGVVASLVDMQKVTDAVGRELRRRKETRGLLEGLVAINGVHGIEDISNRKAVEGLIELGEANTAEFGHHGMRSRLGAEIPGVKVHVLGPPTLDQSEAIGQQRSEDAAEYWHLTANGREVAAHTHRLFSEPAMQRPTLQTAWLRSRIDDLRRDQLFEIVRTIDDALNNTSLILLFEVGAGVRRRLLLFSGDAQFENWEYTLFGPNSHRWLPLLSQVDLYKVGHHGSLNGTPKTLWNGFANKGASGVQNRLRTVVSTKGGVHGSTSRSTEVPRRTLVAALQANSNFLTTQSIKGNALFRDIEIPV